MTLFHIKKIKGTEEGGFTIIETLVAIAILMIAIAGPLTIVHKSLLAAVYAQNQVVASYLAQDGIEYLKNVRENNLIAGRTWLDKLSGCVIGNVCSVDTLGGDPNASAGSVLTAGIQVCNSSCSLFLSDSGYSPFPLGGVVTQYSRYFYIKPNKNNPDNEVKLVVVVTWNTGTINNVMTYEDELFNIIK